MKSARIASAVLAGSVGAWAISPASAALVNVDFNGAHNQFAGSDPGPNATGLGPATNDGYGTASDSWNAANGEFGGTVANLKNSDGVTNSGVGLTWSSSDSWDVGVATNSPNLNLSQDFIFNSGTVTLSGLAANTTYSLYVVSINDNDDGSRPTTIALTDGSTTSATSQTSLGKYNQNSVPAGVWTSGQQYVQFNGLTPGIDGNVTFTFTGNGVGTVNGFQLVSTPEPTSLGLVALGAIGLLRRRRTRML